MRWDVGALEKDMQRIIGKKAWNMCIEVSKMHAVELDDGFMYVNMPVRMKEKIVNHISEHPSSRLGIAYVSSADGLRFRTYKLNKS